MKLLTIIPTYWPEGSGGTLATHLIVKKLLETNNMKLTILTGTSNPEIIKNKNIRYVTDPFMKKIEKRFPSPFIVLNRYGKLIEKHDIVYIIYAYPFVPVAKKLKKKIVVHLHDYKIVSPSSIIPYTFSDDPTITNLIKESFKIKYLERKNIKSTILNTCDTLQTIATLQWIQMSDKIITVSYRHAELIEKLIPAIKNKIVTIYNPMPTIPKKYNKKLSPMPTFLYVGGDSYVKGFFVFMNAIRYFIEEGGNAKFIFSNRYNKKSLAYIKNINKKYGKELIQVVGKVHYSKLLKLHQRAWALIFPSIWEEPLPYTILESLMLRTLPIASNIGGIPELIRSKSIRELLVRPGDANDIKEKMLKIAIMDQKEIEKINKQLIEDFNHLKQTLFISNKNIINIFYSLRV